ncbi:hypothetical protein HK405_000644, partial [Cladochytrium tenue]
VLGRPLLALMMDELAEIYDPLGVVALLLSPRSGLSLDAQSDAYLRDLWVEAVVLDRSKIVCETRGAKLRGFLGPLSASVVAQ